MLPRARCPLTTRLFFHSISGSHIQTQFGPPTTAALKRKECSLVRQSLGLDQQSNGESKTKRLRDASTSWRTMKLLTPPTLLPARMRQNSKKLRCFALSSRGHPGVRRSCGSGEKFRECVCLLFPSAAVRAPSMLRKNSKMKGSSKSILGDEGMRSLFKK